MGSATQFIMGSVLLSVSKFFYPLFTFIRSLLFSLHVNGGSSKEGVESVDHSELVKSEPETEILDSAGPEIERGVFCTVSEEEKHEALSSLSFRFPTFEEFCKGNGTVTLTTSATHADEKMSDEELAESDCRPDLIGSDSGEDGFLSDGDFWEKIDTDDSDEELAESDCRPGLIGSDSGEDGFLSDGDFWEKIDTDDSDEEHLNMDVTSLMTEVLTLEEEPEHENDVVHDTTDQPETVDFLSEEDFDRQDSNHGVECVAGGGKDDVSSAHTTTVQASGCSDDSEKSRSKDGGGDMETMWEHQDLVEQLKMELRKVKATGLPTILEESESPKIMEDLKPWKIEERFHREDCMGELHKIYKSYRERMRKFDIFNFQKMYAIGFLQLKDPFDSISSPKPSSPTLKSLLSQNIWPVKAKSNGSDPMVKFMQELQSDLEVVYVGQMCLSWEFLHWQYGKALELWDSDPRCTHRYNLLAGEFQQFQVLLQRFIENEHFQGSRVQYYIKQRCIYRNLLQVPVIKEDSVKDGRKLRKGDRSEYEISSEMLVEILEESIRIFWRFVRADKDCSSNSSSHIGKSHKPTPSKLQNPDDLELLMDVKRALHKKERKLKDIVRSGNCILKKLRRCREDDVDQFLYFFSQVDMKLVSRVLNMNKISTEQLVWCHSKLSRINFENRKIQVEPSFLLFPCL